MFHLLTLFAATSSCSKPTFFGLVPWYQYLELKYSATTKSCEIVNFQLLGNGANSGLLLILLAIVQDLLTLAGIVAVGYVIFAGIKYITSQGSPDETSKAQSTLVNALIGMVIAMISVATVAYIGSRIGSGGGVGTDTGLDLRGLPNTAANATTLRTILSIVFGVIGALSLLFITLGGFRYITAQGDPQNTAKAKNTILYALVGLIVALVAQSIVTFVIGRTT